MHRVTEPPCSTNVKSLTSILRSPSPDTGCQWNTWRRTPQPRLGRLPSIHAQADRLDHLLPARDLDPQPAGELLRRAGDRLVAVGHQALPDIRHLNGARDLPL